MSRSTGRSRSAVRALAFAGALALTTALGPVPASSGREVTPRGPARVAPGTWSRPVDLTDGSYRVVRPVVVVSADGRRITALWRRDAPVALESVSSADGGRTWREPVLVTPKSHRGTFYQLSGSGDGRRLAAIYQRGGRLYVARSSTSGRTWRSGVRLASGLDRYDGSNPDLAISADGKRVVATFTKSGVLMARVSTDAGATWAPTQWVSRLGLGGGRGRVVMSRSGTHVTAAWTTGNAGNRVAMFATTSRDGGRTWPRPRTLVRAENVLLQNNQGPLLVGSANGRRATAVWALERIGPFDSVVQTTSTRDRGKSWTKPVRLALGAGPAIAASRDGKRVTVAYGLSGRLQYWSRASGDAGASWRSAVPTNVRSDTYFGPSMAAAADGTPTLAVSEPGVRVLTGARSGVAWSVPVVLREEGYGRPVVGVAANGTRRVVIWNDEDHPRVSIGS